VAVTTFPPCCTYSSKYGSVAIAEAGMLRDLTE
jgi:hypothetical protein